MGNQWAELAELKDCAGRRCTALTVRVCALGRVRKLKASRVKRKSSPKRELQLEVSSDPKRMY